MTKDDNHTGALLEVISDQLVAIREGQQAMSSVPVDIHALKEDLAEVKADIKTIKAAVVDQSRQLSNHEERINTLEKVA